MLLFFWMCGKQRLEVGQDIFEMDYLELCNCASRTGNSLRESGTEIIVYVMGIPLKQPPI